MWSWLMCCSREVKTATHKNYRCVHFYKNIIIKANETVNITASVVSLIQSLPLLLFLLDSQYV